MGQNIKTIIKVNAKHCIRERFRYRPFHFNQILFRQFVFPSDRLQASAIIQPSFHISIRNFFRQKIAIKKLNHRINLIQSSNGLRSNSIKPTNKQMHIIIENTLLNHTFIPLRDNISLYLLCRINSNTNKNEQ